MKVFIAGARQINTLDEKVKSKLYSIYEKGFEVLLGDCYGVDSLVQEFYNNLNYKKVTIYASNGKVRNNIGNWKIKNIAAFAKGFDFYAKKDMAMAETCDLGFMIWNGESKGTLNSIVNLLNQDKQVIVYFNDNLYNILSFGDLESLLRLCPARAMAIYNKLTKTSHQVAMF